MKANVKSLHPCRAGNILKVLIYIIGATRFERTPQLHVVLYSEKWSNTEIGP